MNRVPRRERHEHQQPRYIELYQDEIPRLSRLVKREIKYYETMINAAEKHEGSPLSHEKVITAYRDIIDDYKELLGVLSGGEEDS